MNFQSNIYNVTLSDTFGLYLGDSKLNVIGDLVSCIIGYNFAKYLNMHDVSNVPKIIFDIMELSIGFTIRDIVLQFVYPQLYPSKWIQDFDHMTNNGILNHFSSTLAPNLSTSTTPTEATTSTTLASTISTTTTTTTTTLAPITSTFNKTTLWQEIIYRL